MLPNSFLMPWLGAALLTTQLEPFIESTRESWGIPGLAVAVVSGEELLLARGYGVRRAGATEPVDAHTLFAIGSTTKAFTATAVAMLVDDRLISWDDRVAGLVPGFSLKNRCSTGAITIRDALAHRSGLPMANLMWLSGLHDSEALIGRLRHLEPVSGLRESFTYQNVLYLATGRIIEAVTGHSWEAFVTGRILRPLGMAGTRVNHEDTRAAANIAAPHIMEGGAIRAVPYRDIDAIGPAGSMLSNASDMVQWLRFQLSGGVANGRRLLDEKTLFETREPQMLIRREGPVEAFYPDTRSLAYAMGWVVSEYRGRVLYDHGGGIDGMTALVALIPEADIGVALLTNLQTATPPYWLLYPIIDLLLGEAPVDRGEGFGRIEQAVRSSVESGPPRIEGTRPSTDLGAYVGRFSNPALGGASVIDDGNGPVFRFGRFIAPLEHWHFNTFRLDWTDRAWKAAAGPGWLTFGMNVRGEIDGFDLVPYPGESWRFTRDDAGADENR